MTRILFLSPDPQHWIVQAANLQIEIKGKQSDLETARSRCSSLEEYVEEILRQNETFREAIKNTLLGEMSAPPGLPWNKKKIKKVLLT